ncbi:MAG: hypothetical protein HYY07_02845, partial [Elusimicrobia bacterium]|nr:hypothetical protein [Elusimicrobiota bacterium]
FIRGDELKRDLSWLYSEWESLPDEVRGERKKQYGNYPPVNEKSITYMLWEKYMKPRGNEPVNRLHLLSEERKKEMAAQIRALVEGKDIPDSKFGKPSGDFLIRKISRTHNQMEEIAGYDTDIVQKLQAKKSERTRK